MVTSHFTWKWHQTFRGVALYLDDLRRIEGLFDATSAKRWTLLASDGSGVATLIADSLDDLVEARHGIASADEISFAVGDRYTRSDAVWASLKTISKGWMEPRPGWDVELGAVGANKQQAFESARRGIEEVFSRSTMSTWPQRHPRLRAAFNVVLSVLAVSMILLPLGRWVFHWQGFNTAGATAFYAVGPWLMFSAWLIDRRVSRLWNWFPPLYDLSTERAGAAASGPPTFLARDIVLFLLAIVIAVGLFVLGIALKTS